MSQKLFLDYLETLGAEKLNQLFIHHPSCSLFIYRIIPPLAQYLVQRLLLIEGPVPFQTEIRSWHPPSQRAAQNKALWKLKQLSIIQGKANEIWLNQNFRESLLTAISNPTVLWSNSGTIEDSSVEDHFHSSWNGVLFCVASGGKSHELYTNAAQNATTVLLNAGLISKERNQISITNQGFQFLLSDTSEQISTLLIQYCMDSPETEQVDILHLIMTLSLLIPGRLYDMKDLTGVQKRHLKVLSEYGLLLVKKNCFSPTRLAKAVSYTGEMPLMLTKEDGFLIIETNYKIYAYTDSPLHRTILGLFMRIKTQFPNMIFGHLSQDSVQDAFKKGITAAQIVKFLSSSAHQVMRSKTPILPPTIVDQINLWEQDRNRLRAKPGYMYQQFLSAADFEKTLAEGNRIGAILYANSATRIMVVSDVGHSQIKTFVKNNL